MEIFYTLKTPLTQLFYNTSDESKKLNSKQREFCVCLLITDKKLDYLSKINKNRTLRQKEIFSIVKSSPSLKTRSRKKPM